MPISTEANDANDSGRPLSLARPDRATEELSAFESLASALCTELLKLQCSHPEGAWSVSFGSAPEAFDLASLQLSKEKGSEFLVVRLYGVSGALQLRLTPAQLRSRDPQSGDAIGDSPFLDEALAEAPPSRDTTVVALHKVSSKKTPSLSVARVDRKGRYGYSVHFADGAVIIYSMKSLARAAGGDLIETSSE
jgi:hypothetical protein